jgi:G:T/U-mismatch repair DNA glycosylase
VIVPDVIDHDLRVPIVGVNPGVRSGQTRHYFAHPSGRHWEGLLAADLTTGVLEPLTERGLSSIARISSIWSIAARVFHRAVGVPGTSLAGGRRNVNFRDVGSVT